MHIAVVLLLSVEDRAADRSCNASFRFGLGGNERVGTVTARPFTPRNTLPTVITTSFKTFSNDCAVVRKVFIVQE